MSQDPGQSDSTSENNQSEPQEKKDYPMKGIPNLDFYQKTYGRSCGNNDDKAGRVFKEYENADRIKRVKAELIAMSQGKVSPVLCERILGKTRYVKFGSWEKWAIMLINVIQSQR